MKKNMYLLFVVSLVTIIIIPSMINFAFKYDSGIEFLIGELTAGVKNSYKM